MTWFSHHCDELDGHGIRMLEARHPSDDNGLCKSSQTSEFDLLVPVDVILTSNANVSGRDGICGLYRTLPDGTYFYLAGTQSILELLGDF